MTSPIIEFHVDFTALSEALDDLQYNQMPFATSKAINRITLLARDAIRTEMEKNFTIRRDWVVRGVDVLQYSRKQDTPIAATLGVREDRDFLNKFETGTPKTARSGRNVAVPTDFATGAKSGIVPKNLRPKALRLHAYATKAGKQQTKGERRSFLLPMKDGQPGVFQRIGSGRFDIVLLYALVPTVHIRPMLGLREIAKRVIDAVTVQVFNEELANALATAR